MGWSSLCNEIDYDDVQLRLVFINLWIQIVGFSSKMRFRIATQLLGNQIVFSQTPLAVLHGFRRMSRVLLILRRFIYRR